MSTLAYIYWDGSPVLFKTGIYHLPFPVSLIGLGLAVILYYFAYPWLQQKRAGKQPRRSEQKELPLLPGSWVAGLAAGCLILGQLILLPFPLPVLHTFGPVTVRWYGLMFAIAFLLGYYLGLKMFRDAGIPPERLESLLTYIIIGTVVGARLGHVLFYEPAYYFAHPGEIIKIWHGGLASHGAAIGILIAIWLYIRKYPSMHYLWVLDRVVIPVAIGGAFVRIGNFFNSEIIGKVSHVAWAVIFARVDLDPRHPSMLYESLCYMIGFVLLWYLYRRYHTRPPEGFLLGVFLVYVFTGRFLIEYTKVRQALFAEHWALSMGQILSIPFVLIGIWLIIKKWRPPAEAAPGT